ncbi:hypothetical protein BpHYR1_034258 [Brachionus plicatilis]|uniref:Uncharacterized protein n=1 Tax=Brachionus plicatilis TaxID=10195 RepID=A0A3M7RAG5_BRAPC|nr:hypothetical protein BpHYR1_034258 [Brachionus plicatilis]
MHQNVVFIKLDLIKLACWEPYKRPLMRPKIFLAANKTALTDGYKGGRPLWRPDRRPKIWTAELAGQMYGQT